MNNTIRLGCLLGVLLAGQGAVAMQTDNHGIRAVPTPGKVTIDGKLDDWDLSGQVLICYDVNSLKDIYSGRVALMHDTDHLYVSIHWKDPIPLGNRHDPRFQVDKGWAGDSVQLRIKTDRICHVTAWCFAGKMEPFINIEYGKSLTEPFGGGSADLYRKDGWILDQGAEMAFRKDDDGEGYVQEMKLPWSLITLGGLAALGERFACGVELLWGEADWPVHRYADNLQEGQTSREFFWTARDAWGPVFLEKSGKLKLSTPSWELPVAAEPPEGSVKIAYTLPRDQRVTLAIDDAQGRRVRNLLPSAERQAGAHTDLWDCLDDNGKLVPPGRYIVRGLRHDGLHLTYESSFASPGNPPWNTADGKGAFYGDHTPPEAVAFGPGDRGALACAMGEAGPHLIGVDLQGRRQWGLANRRVFGGGRISLATDGKILWIANVDGGDNRFSIWRCDLKTGAYAAWNRKDKDGKQILDLPIREKDGLEQMRAIAVKGNSLAVILAGEHKVLLLDAETGDTVKKLVNLPDDLTAITFRPDGKLLLAAADRLYVADPAAAAPTVLASGLIAPHSLAVDAQGRIYVSQRGTAMNVAVFAADGQPLAAIGKLGGRPAAGFFDETGMLNPAQIAIDSQGRLWVTESHQQPKRTSVWTPDGKLAFDLIGTTAYAAGGHMNPFTHTVAFSEETEYRWDEARQTWRPFFTLADALGTGFGWVTRFARVNGHEYLQVRSTARDSSMVKILVRGKDGGWRHCAEFGNVGLGKTLDEADHQQWNRRFAGPLWQGRFGKVFCWVDRDDDGSAQFDEIQTCNGHLGGYYWGQTMGEDLTVVIPGQDVLWTWKPETFSAEGTPLFALDKVNRIKPESGISGEGMLLVGRDNRCYLNQTPLCAVDPAGKVLWTYPNHFVSVHGSHRAPAPRPGLLIGPSSFYGTAWVNQEVGEVLCLNGNLGQNFIFTEDGLWVQSLWNDCRGWYDVPAQATPGMPCDAMTAGGESFGGWFCKTEDGKYHVIGGGTAAIVYELSGLDSLRCFSVLVDVTQDDLVAAEELRVRRAARALRPKACTIKPPSAAPALDGELASWQMDKDSVEIAGGGGGVGKAKAFYDDKNLYVAWQVKDNSAMRNAGQDERLMFITGDGVDLMLRTSAAKDDKPVAGDLRLLLTVKGGKPLAVLYQPVAPGAAKEEGGDLSSPWRVVHFDRIKVLDIPLAMKPVSGGYAVTAAIPLATLGLDSLKGKVLRGDFGILLSDSAGQECTSRNYWSNQAANNTNDVPDEAMLTPALWSELRFE